MHLRKLLDHKNVIDVIATKDKLYVIAEGETPDIYSDKQTIKVSPKEILARDDITEILSGDSVRHGQLRQKHHLERKLLYTYDVSELSPTDKQRVSHGLYGTGGRKSLLESLQGERVGRNAFLIPAASKEELEGFLTDHGARWTARPSLIGGEIQ